jgi:chromate transporter
LEVLLAFFKLGISSFGGPIAHIGYFREEFVVRRCWLDEHAFADLVGLCQFLPGPASSQVGFSIGLMRAGFPGALAAWTGFTFPSAIILVVFAYGAERCAARSAQGSSTASNSSLLQLSLRPFGAWRARLLLIASAHRLRWWRR